MRERLNNDPKAQVAAIAVLVVLAAFFFVSKMGGGVVEEGAVEATVAVAGTEATGTATGATPGEAVEGAVESAVENTSAVVPVLPSNLEAPPPPAPVTAAYRAGETVALLIVRDNAIEDDLVKRSAEVIEGMEGTALFVVPVSQIARYAAITLGVEVSRVPALVVMAPKGASHGEREASVTYGFQTPQTLEQAVRDAGYTGPVATYHPN
jgi:hypothetical protein